MHSADPAPSAISPGGLPAQPPRRRHGAGRPSTQAPEPGRSAYSAGAWVMRLSPHWPPRSEARGCWHDQVNRHIESNGARSSWRGLVERGQSRPGSGRAHGCGAGRTPTTPSERAFEFAAERACDRTLARTDCDLRPLSAVCGLSRLADVLAGFARSFGACASASPRFRCSGASSPPTRRSVVAFAGLVFAPITVWYWSLRAS